MGSVRKGLKVEEAAVVRNLHMPQLIGRDRMMKQAGTSE